MPSSSPMNRFPLASYLSSTRASIAASELAFPDSTAAMKASGVNELPEACWFCPIPQRVAPVTPSNPNTSPRS